MSARKRNKIKMQKQKHKTKIKVTSQERLLVIKAKEMHN